MFKLKSKYTRLTPEQRMHGCQLPIIGITGGIASGKSTVSNMAKELGLPVIDADGLIKKIYAQSETIEFIKSNYPQVVKDERIIFQSLRELFFNNEKIKNKIEKYLYEKLPDAFHEALSHFQNDSFVIYDVPLLFEKNLDKVIDTSVCVYAPKKEQIIRLKERDQISDELAQSIIKSQMGIEAKKNKANYIIDNSGAPKELNHQFQEWLSEFFERP